jgi:lipase chaperone LimK
MKEYRCTRNALYLHDCTGRNDIRERQGYYISAESEEEAWQKMATRFPEETAAGFTVQEWEGFNVKVVELRRDENGNIIE